ncbi:MAG: DNA-processing protein DprA [Patescibacteria group bacterium]
MLIEELKYCLGIIRFPKIGSVRLKRLFNYFPSLKDAFNARPQEMMQAGIEMSVAEEFAAKRKFIDPESELEKFQSAKLKAIFFTQPEYPAPLKQIHGSPALLFYRGNIECLSKISLAVVGTRKISGYGQQIVPELVRGLVKAELTLVSGLALGIDSLVHSETIKYGGKTIAVLGSSIDRENIYPTSNRYLAQQILDNGGLLLSEYPIGTLPLRHNFPTRNRIISGLSVGTLVIEAGETSGALITAKYALDQNREVFAVPGPITSPVSQGTNDLIKQGAKLVTGVDDILEELNIEKIEEYSENKKILPASPIEQRILEILSDEPKHIDLVVKLTGLSAGEINSNLTIMEMKGMVKNLGNQNYVKS